MSGRWVKAGEIGVDAGLCWIGDPCYVRDGEGPFSAPEGGWDGFCAKLYPRAYAKRGTSSMEEHGYQEFHEGIVTSTGVGDGSYPVFVRLELGQVAEVRVVFLPDEDSPEDVEEPYR